MKDFLFNLIVITAVTKNMSSREICALATTAISQLKTLEEENCIEIHIIGKSVYNDALQKQIALLISLNHDVKHLNVKILQNKVPETSIECVEYLLKNIQWISVCGAYILSLRREFTKTQLIWYYFQKEIYIKKRNVNIEVLTTADETPSRNKIFRFIEIIKIIFHFSIKANLDKRQRKKNIALKPENGDFNTLEDAKLDTIKKTHKNL